MPNWTVNHITLSEKILKKYLDADGNFDFNKLIPMPEDLNVESGSNEVYSIAYYLSDRLTKDISNITFHKFNDSNSLPLKETVNRLKQDKENGTSHWDWEKLYENGEKYVSNFNRYGHTTWYSWCWDNWSVKWNACCSHRERTLDGGRVVFTFDTPWNLPEKIFDKLCELHPTAKIDFDGYYETGETYTGINRHGKFVLTSFEDSPGWGEDEADESGEAPEKEAAE